MLHTYTHTHHPPTHHLPTHTHARTHTHTHTELRQEIEQLRALMGQGVDLTSGIAEIRQLREKLRESEKLMTEATRSVKEGEWKGLRGLISASSTEPSSTSFWPHPLSDHTHFWHTPLFFIFQIMARETGRDRSKKT